MARRRGLASGLSEMEASAKAGFRRPAIIFAIPLVLLGGLVAALLSITLVFGATSPGCGAAESTGTVNSQVPARLAPVYVAAAARYDLGAKGPAILAGINYEESNFGRSTLPGVRSGSNSAGAAGPMQFLYPSSWEAFGVDGDGDGIKNVYDPDDAIFAAANLLHAEGAPGDWHAAIFAYNHAEWYVEDVLADAQRFGGVGALEVAESTSCAAEAGPALQKILAEADRLNALHIGYVWGGSHGESPTPPNGPFDCSSAVSHLLQVGGFGNPTMDTTELVGWGEPGPGRYLTIHVKPYGEDAHTFIEFGSSVTPDAKRYWGTSGTNPGGGPGWIPKSTFSTTYLAGFQVRHPPGL